MTKKEQAALSLVSFLGATIANKHAPTPELVHCIINLVHAIDEAEREERGVLDVDEIKTCFDCRFYYDEGCCCMHEKQCERGLFGEDHELPGPPSWCPRRKENRK